MLTEMEKGYLIELVKYKIEEMDDLNDEDCSYDADIAILKGILEKLNQ